MTRTVRQPATASARSRARSASKAASVRWVARPVELERQPLRAPQAVDLEGAAGGLDPRVGLGTRQARRGEELPEALLELTPGDGGAGAAIGQERPHARGPGPPRVPRKQIAEGQPIAEAKHLGLVDRARELAGVEDGGQVEQRARHGRDRNPTVHGHLVAREHSSVPLQPRPSRYGPGRRHLDRRATRAPELPQHRGRAMAQHRTRAVRQHRRHPSALDGQARMPHGIDPAVHAMKVSLHDAVLHRPATEARGDQLPIGHDAVLAGGESRDDGVHALRSNLSPHQGHNFERVRHTPSVTKKL